MSVGTPLRWTLRHGLARTALRLRRGSDDQTFLLTAPEIVTDPYPFYERLRAKGPLNPGGLGVLSTSHRVCATVLRADGWSAGLDHVPLPRPMRAVIRRSYSDRVLSPLDPPSLLVADPPDHTRLRQLVSRVFTARAMEALRPRVEQIAHDLLDRLAADEEADLVGRYASLLPVTVIAEVLGVPVAARERFLAWGAAASPALDLGLSYRTYRQSERALTELVAWMRGHFDRLRAEPGDDLLSRLVTQVDGDRLSETELLSVADLMLVAGFETTVSLIGNGIVLLLEHPDQLALLRAEPTRWSNVADEVLRYDAPVAATGRTAVADTELDGRPVPAGTMVVALLGAANRDPSVFPDPTAFDVTRANAREHLAFSSGVHYCLGAALARIEGEVGLRTLFERYPSVRLAAEPTRRPQRVLRGWSAVPAVLGS